MRAVETIPSSAIPVIRDAPGISAWRPRIAILLLSVSLGCLYAYLLVGPRVLNPLDISWLRGDPATTYLAWAFLRQEPALTMPLGQISAMGYPIGVPIAYFDAIPPLAIFGWLIRSLLPQDFQYFGLYMLLSATLQFYFGFRISRRIAGGDLWAGVLGGCFFLTAPAFTWRAHGHFALTSQWILLALLDQLLGATTQADRSRIAWTGALCFIAGAINPYITLMALVICGGVYIRPLLGRDRDLGRAAAGLAVAAGAAGLGLLLFGFLITTDVTQYIGDGYQQYSMNLLGPIDPEFPGALLIRQMPIRNATQMEGYNYLGLGLLLLAVVSLARCPALLGRLVRPSWLPVLLVFAASLLLALSVQVTFGSRMLFSLPLPHPVVTALSTFRASGRLFWPGYYLVFAGVLAVAFAAFRGRRLYVALGVALLIQVLDLAPLRARVHDTLQALSAPPMPADPAWHELGRAQRHLMVLPAWQCAVATTPGGKDGYAIFGRLALEQHMTINSYYAGRYSAAQRRLFCAQHLDDVDDHGLRADTAYVFAKEKASWVAGLQHGAHYCRYADDYILCSLVPGRSGLSPAILRDVVALGPGETVSFAGTDPVGRRLQARGWSVVEPWGRWIEGHAATLTFRVRENGSRDVVVELAVQALVRPDHPAQRLVISANGTPVSRHTFTNMKLEPFRFVVPAHLIGPDGLVQLEFDCPDAVSPASIGMARDPRVLGIGVARLKIASVDP